ncbi:unnamed protein product [Cuscuta epithymum]|uniref:Retrotransposon gag domain-containing protein n=1 Tax=Cuscuta epithymum TaxID=186058 RepID=A0AAV0DNP9_9ASTE|nr:unnamed protein product [Cuscuta epithymum]
MQISPDVKLTVASRLLEGIASTWWESVEGKYHGEVSWLNFEQEFYDQYYTDYEKNVKRREYTNLKQKEGVSVKQLEQDFRTLARFLPEYAINEDRMSEHFWDALLLDIRDRATYSRHMTFSEVVEQVLLGEAQWNERKERDAEEAKKRKWHNSGPPEQARKNNHGGGGGTFKAPAPPAKKNKDARWHASSSQNTGPPKCANCSKNHFGKCNAPPRCYRCGNTGHMKANYPQLGGGGAPGSGGRTMTGRNRAGPSNGGTGRGGASTSHAASVNQGGAQARVYAMTEADARANPDSVTG